MCRYIIITLTWLPPYLTFKSEENLSPINDSESLNFESINYNPWDNDEVIFLVEVCDPNSNFYNANVQKSDTPHISSEEFPSLRMNTEQNDFSILHLNIRSIKKSFFRKHGWMMTSIT